MPTAQNAICRSSSTAGLCLITGTALAALTEAIAGTVLSFARLDMMGDAGATADEFARMDFGYTAAKLIAFVMAAWLAGRFSLKTSLLAATVAMTVASGLAAYTHDLEVLFAMRLLQGFSGGLILVSAQALLLKSFAKPHQALIQSVYAVAAVVAPATLVPYMNGWLLDAHSWTWIFLATALIGLAALALLPFAPAEREITPQPHEINWYSIGLFMTTVSCLTYVLN
jgi:DHA2 family multidrug resistance protein